MSRFKCFVQNIFCSTSLPFILCCSLLLVSNQLFWVLQLYFARLDLWYYTTFSPIPTSMIVDSPVTENQWDHHTGISYPHTGSIFSLKTVTLTNFSKSRTGPQNNVVVVCETELTDTKKLKYIFQGNLYENYISNCSKDIFIQTQLP